MCGRFTLRTPTPVLIEQFRLDEAIDRGPRYNIAPSQDIAVVRQAADGTRVMNALWWGLAPSWAKDPGIGNRMINARSETAAEKPSFRAAFKRRRRLIPADGFYEWVKGAGKQKQPYLIEMADAAPFALAGLWEHWPRGAQSGDPERIETCTILTTEAAGRMAEIHDRMPVILSPNDYDPWLDAKVEEAGPLEYLFEPFPSEELSFNPVSTHVNNPRNDDSECVVHQRTLF